MKSSTVLIENTFSDFLENIIMKLGTFIHACSKCGHLYARNSLKENVCPKCKMKFEDPKRTLKHMIKAHPAKKQFNCDSCGFRN